MPTLHIRLLDGFDLRWDDGPAVSIPAPRQQELLAYLLLRRDASQPRQQMAFLLWPETTDSQARNNLRRDLSRLRSQWPEAERWLEVEAHTLRWRMVPDVRLDVADFENALAQAESARRVGKPEEEAAALQIAVDGYRGPLLPAFYAEWMLAERERLAQRHLQSLERLTELYEAERRYSDAIQTAQRQLRNDPLAENTYRQLMRLHAAAGDRPQALRVYHTCVTTLRRELGVEPDFETVTLYQRLLQRETEARPPAPPAQTPGQDALVGRQAEWRQLLAIWRQAAAGKAHFLLIAGEAGIGKSRLAAELYEWVRRLGMAAARSRAYAAEDGLAYLPVVEWLRSESLRPTLSRLHPLWLGEVCRLLPELLAEHPHLSPPPPLTEEWQRRQMLEGLCRACAVENQPRLLLLDDLQWCDEATLAWLRFFLRFAPTSPTLLLATVRPQEVPPDHPLTALVEELRGEGQFTQLALGPLSAEESARLAEQAQSRPLDPKRRESLLAETGGNPLFVIETAKAGGAQEGVRVGQGEGERFLPPRIYAVIRSRLEGVSPPARQAISVAAAFGRSFRFSELAGASHLAEDPLVDALDELWRRGIIREDGTDGYDFSHDRIRDVAYAELSPVRRPHIHRSIAQALEQIYAEERDEMAARLAGHWAAAGELGRAAACYQQAAEVALQRLAYSAAVAHFHAALAALEKLPQTRSVKEQTLHALLQTHSPVRLTKGWVAPEMSSLSSRALALSQEVGTPAQRLFALNGIKANLMMQGQQRKALEYVQQMLQLVDAHPGELSHRESAETQIQAGSILLRIGQLEAALRAFRGEKPDPLRPTSHWEIHALWLLGYADQARRRLAEVRHPGDRPPSEWLISHTVALQASYGMRSQESVEALAQELAAGAEQYEAVFWQAMGGLAQGWLWVEKGDVAAGIGQMAEAIQRMEQTGAGVLTLFLGMQASGYARAGQYPQALAALEQALAYADDGGEYFWYAELLRQKGDVVLAQGGAATEVEALYGQAIVAARSQSARFLELRATVSLGRLWQSQGRATEARSLISPLYDWFTEGFDTADLSEARNLLDQLN